ncbi:MAG: acyloxyacyl hydrolase [Rickettsiaceae bacterium]|nr:acyloxyacyl hydrolase [Rickettsiaceae bacterium]
MIRYIIIAFIIISITSRAYAQEVRLGLMHHDIAKDCNHRREKGQNISAEIIFDDFDKILYAYWHVGVTANNQDYTSSAYTGLSWRINLIKEIFIELTFGGAVNNGKSRSTARKKKAIGSNLLFRESISIGAIFKEVHTVSIILEHMSNADFGSCNPGFTDLGVRYGYKF